MREVKPGIVVMLFGFLGVFVAAIEKTLYDRGVGVTALSTCGLSLVGLMTLTIVVAILFGLIAAMVTR